MAGIELVVDTFAWVELLAGTPLGEEVYALHPAHDVGTPVVVLAELAHLDAPRLPDRLDEVLEAVAATSAILPVEPGVAAAAGRTRARLEATRKGIGLVDRLVLETARANGADLLTADPHPRGLDGVRFLPSRSRGRAQTPSGGSTTMSFRYSEPAEPSQPFHVRKNSNSPTLSPKGTAWTSVPAPQAGFVVTS